MLSARLTRQIALAAGAAALVGMGTLTACSSTKEKPADTTAPSPSSSAPAVAPTEKSVGGPNSFSPTIKAPKAPTALPGNVITGN
ncbi:MAG TPA: hypothetical protein PLH92_05110 [Mycobacterium sp.]|nr:hypothetical protein [Mycolicibacterium sp.]HPX35813.1 hypothetical protein [Mycobacterium sp.]HQC76083.1 hypothetical protein [Mycobacterium sp.]